jgi:hypothetical protein
MANERRYEFINKSPMFHLVLHSWLDTLQCGQETCH